MRAALLLAAAASLLAGCIAPITPMERLQQSANDVAGALRFGRTDLAAEYCSAVSHDDFLSRHAVWSKKTRVVDLELTGIYMRASDEAEAILSVSWLDEDGADLHTTEISQQWKQLHGGFRLADELFRGGDKALFDMLPKKEDAKKSATKGAEAAKNDGAPAQSMPAQSMPAQSMPAQSMPAQSAPVPHARLETRTIRDE